MSAFRTSLSAVVMLLSAGCTNPGGTPPPGPALASSPPEADVCGNPEACAAWLRKAVKSPNRDWVGKLQSPDAYGNGTRLFAYRMLRKKLSCGELGLALGELGTASNTLHSERHARARKLATDVTAELQAERTRRC